MINEWLFIGSVILYFGTVIILYKYFGKTGLYAWTAFAAALSSIEASKIVTLFGISVTLGNVIYGSSFLVTDILSENHGKKAANGAVLLGIITTLVWAFASSYLCWFIPNGDDFLSPNIHAVFGFVPRIAISGILTYAISQALDIFLYHYLWKLCGHSSKMLWLRNNGSTLISQFLDTVIFTVLAFYGTVPHEVLLILIVSTYVFKVIISLLDTPVVYLARWMHKNNKAGTLKLD